MTSVNLEDGLLAGVEKFIADRDEPPRGRMSYEEAINDIVRDWWMGQGYVPLPCDRGSITPALDAANVPAGKADGDL